MTRTQTKTGEKKASLLSLQSPNLVFLFFLIFMIICSSVFISVSGNSIQQEDVELPEQFVRGYFNEISYSNIDEKTHLEMTHPDASQNYVWTYEDGWEGDLNYIDLENTSYDGDSWAINIAIHGDEPTGDWILQIDEQNFEIEVVEPDTSFSVSGDIHFYLEPYQEEAYSDEGSVTFRNTGNVPMKIEVIYEDDDLVHDSSKDVFYPDESGQIVFQYISSTGGLIKFAPSVSVEPFSIGAVSLVGEGNVAVISQGAVGLNFGVTVGYRGYEQAQADNFEVQYLESMEVRGNSHNNLTFYVYPHDDIDFGVDGEDVEIIEISENTDEPLRPNEKEEIELVVHFRSHHENDGYIELVLDGNRYTTNIQLSETVPQPVDEEVSFLEEKAETVTLGIILIIGVLIFGVFRVFLSRRKGDA